MSDKLRQTIYQALCEIRLIDPHTHINPHSPASSTLADLLGYHYYTELAHSAGMPRETIEEPGLSPREKVGRLVAGLEPLENTIQYSWLIDICRRFFDFDGTRLDASNWEAVYDAAEQKMQFAEWPDTVLQQSNVEAVFLTNDFDDDLAGFDTNQYIPCLRTDDLVFHLAKPEVRDRLTGCSGIEVTDLSSLRTALEQRFEHFVGSGARACAISLPPGFTPGPIADGRAATALDAVLQHGPSARPAQRDALARRVFWTLAELCDHHGLPFDLMIGVNRGVYPGGVFQGQDLYDSRVSLIQYKTLFNAFANVRFPVSVLASVTNQELVSYAWIFPNVIPNGHWWYSNTPSFIERDAAARLEAVPQTKQIGYYSDAYKLEFVAPKFDMYRRILAKVLGESFVIDRGWSEEQAVELGRKVLRGNVEAIFPEPKVVRADDLETIDDDALEMHDPSAGADPAVVPAIGGVAGVFMEQAPPAAQEPDSQEPAAQEPEIQEPAADRESEVAFDERQEVADEQDDAGLWGLDETVESPSTSDRTVVLDEPQGQKDTDSQPDPDEFRTAELDELPTVVEELMPPSPAPQAMFDAQLEQSDEQDDAELWNREDDDDESLTLIDGLPTIAEDTDDQPSESPAVAFDQQLADADEEDDALLWSEDDEDDGDLTLEPPTQEPSGTPLPTLEEYQPLSDSGTSLLSDEKDNDSDFGQLSDGSSLTEDDEDSDAQK